MKILVLQLARLGDIYMTWPVLRALRAQNPSAQIDILVRPRFLAACEGLEAIDQVEIFPTQDFLSPLVTQGDLESSMQVVDQFVDRLRNKSYDRIINLSFSEVSSYVVSMLANSKTSISGYSRHRDGYLHLTDDVSRYFWAQVGPGGYNQIHLIDLLAATAEVELLPDYFGEPNVEMKPALATQYIVAHIGGSEEHKRLNSHFWTYTIKQILAHKNDYHVVLVGGESDRVTAGKIQENFETRVHNRVGKTKLSELFGFIKYSRGLVGGDSMAMHLLPYVNQRGLCFSRGDVNPFETGPMTHSSWIYRANKEGEWDLNAVDRIVKSWIDQETPQSEVGLMQCGKTFPRVQFVREGQFFAWNLIQAIYMGASFPVAEDLEFYRGCLRMYEANQVCLQNLNMWQKINPKFLTSLLDRVDEIHAKIATEVMILYPLFRWYQAEKTRVQPGTYVEMVTDYKLIIEQFQNLLRQYLLDEDIRKVESHAHV
jgi:heptosyltransferase-3